MQRLRSWISNMHVVLLSAFILVIAVCIGTMTALLSYFWNSSYQRYIEANFLYSINQMASEIVGIYDFNSPLTEEIKMSIVNKAYLNRLFISLQDEKGRVLVDTLKEASTPAEISTTGNRFDNLDTFQLKTKEIVVQGKTKGTLTAMSVRKYGAINYINQEFQESLGRGFRLSLASGIGVSMTIAVLLLLWLTRPLKEMASKSKLYQNGKWDTQLEEKGPEELRTVVRSLNRMAERMVEQEHWRHRFIEDITHELRNPLAVISSQLEAISDGVIQPTAERMDNMKRLVGRLARLVADLEQLRMAEDARFTMSYEQVAVRRVIEGLVRHFQPLCKEKRQTLDYKLPTIPITVMCDSDKLEQILFNLIGNAVKFTPLGGRIEVRVEQSEVELLISVCDTGIGIAKEDLPYIFHRFFRADKARSIRAEGGGLGLSIVKALVDAHQGWVRVDSELGVGTQMTIGLPLAAEKPQVS